MDANQRDATVSTESEINAKLGTAQPANIYLGRYYDAQKDKAGAPILYSGDRHLLVFGPTGSGKGSRFLLPNLLTGLVEQSVIVVDPKGEAAAVTAEARIRMGHDVVILNPFDVLGLGSSGFNPLASLDPESAFFYDDAVGIGEALIKVEGNEPHWSESAQGLVVGLTMWEVLEARREKRLPSLENVRRLLTEPHESEAGADGHRRPTKGLRATVARAVSQGGVEIESLLGRFLRDTDEINSIQSTADTQTRWVLSQPVRADMAKSGVDFGHMKNKRTTIYVILPAERLRTHSVWLRLVIVSALRALYKPGGLRTVMLIDEMAALGHLGPLEDAFGLVRGYNVQIAAILQDLGQLKALYKERWETFVANAGVIFGFAANDLTTADWMSKRSGQRTDNTHSYSSSSGRTQGRAPSSSEGAGFSTQETLRPVFLPHEVIGFEEGMGLLWLAGFRNTTRFFAPDYSRITPCVESAAPNPYRPTARP